MTESADPIKETLAMMESEELLERINASLLTEDAYATASAELEKRGITPPPMKVAQPSLAAHKTYSSLPEVEPQRGLVLGFLLDCYRGKKRLWQAFWLLTLFFAVVLAIIGLAMRVMLPILGPRMAVLLPFFFYCAFVIFINLSVWRCSLRTSSPIWTVLARIVVIANWFSPFVALSRLADSIPP